MIVPCPFWCERWWLPPVRDAVTIVCPLLQQQGLKEGLPPRRAAVQPDGEGEGRQLEEQQLAQPCPGCAGREGAPELEENFGIAFLLQRCFV